MKESSLPQSFSGKTARELHNLLAPLDQPAYRALQIYKWIHHFNADSFSEMTDLPKKLRDKLAAKYRIKSLSLSRREVSADGTEKFLWQLEDGRQVESVLMPEAKRNTICISSQVGCSLGCRFCATGSMGLLRNLSPGEIVEQVLQIKKLTPHAITNIVFMGMGEPFLNYSRSVQAAKVLSDPEGVAVSARRITFSTSGIVPKIYQFTNDKLPFKLAVSLHAPTQELRRQLMPVAEKFPLDELMESLRFYMEARKKNRITFEYVLLHGVNDSVQHMKQLISLLSPFRCKLNLIPCNQNYLGYQPPPAEHLAVLEKMREKAQFPVTIRKNRGEDITAACGQLAVNTSEKSIYMKHSS